MPPLSGSWANALKGEFSKDYYKKLFQTVGAEYKTHTIYPPADDIFNACLLYTSDAADEL